MTDGQTYDLEIAAYPLVSEVVEALVAIPEEIQCLLNAGWTWDGNKLVHPKDKDIWRMYKRIDSPKVGTERFNAEIKQAVLETRVRERESRESGS
jgi:hypothetical protein